MKEATRAVGFPYATVTARKGTRRKQKLVHDLSISQLELRKLVTGRENDRAITN
jgi:hypothetical protein